MPYSNNIRDYTIKEGCPWYEAQQSYGPPNVNWCEPTVCSIINEPANTWSNLSYIIFGFYLCKKIKERPYYAFGPIVIIMGLLSFIYHATNNYLTQYFDFVGMFLMMSFILTFGIKRLFKSCQWGFFTLYWFLVFLNTVIFMVFDIANWPAQPIMLINAVPMIVIDLIAGFKEGRLKEYKFFALALVFLICAQVFAILDIKRIWCNPSNLILHGHVIWHICSGIGMLLVGYHIKRMQVKP